MPRQRVQLVENGVVKHLVYARATAEKDEAVGIQRQSRSGRSRPATGSLCPTKWERRR